MHDTATDDSTDAPDVTVSVTVDDPPTPDADDHPAPVVIAPTPDSGLAVIVGAIDAKLDQLLARLPELQAAADDAAAAAADAADAATAALVADVLEDATDDIEPVALEIEPVEIEPDEPPKPTGWRRLFGENTFH